MNNSTILIFAVLLLAAFALSALSCGSRELPVRPRRLMTDRERRVLELIEAAAPGCRVHAQVAMAAIIDAKPGLPRGRRLGVRNRFDRKIIDYVLECRETGDVIAIVELDDRTHNVAKDAARDRVTAAAGYVTVRIPAGKRVDADLVRERLATLTSGGKGVGTTAALNLGSGPSRLSRRTRPL